MRSMLDDIEAREALHVLVLTKLSEAARPGSFVLKGGVNLRLYFGSPRYSEDLDLDVDPAAKRQVVKAIAEILAGRWLQERLRALGLDGLVYGGKPAKDTDTTVRFKLMVVNKGRIRLPTRIEISLRERFLADAVVAEPPDAAVIRRYIDLAVERPVIPHYPRDPAIRQKLRALASRSVTQARDVFDVHVVARGDVRGIDIAFLKGALPKAELEEASKRALSITYDQFQDQVLEFLPDADRAALSEAEWEARQLFTGELIDVVLRS
jgi:predicted nucleotidyltransferase component of viral defense system